MSWYAIDALNDSFDITTEFLFPVAVSRWLRLTVIVFFLGGAGTVTINISYNPPLPASTSYDPSVLIDIGTRLSTVSPRDIVRTLVVVAGILLTLLLVYALINAVMRFVLIDSIHTKSVQLRRYFRRRFTKGIRLFTFEIGLFVLLALPFLVAAYFLIKTALNGASPLMIALIVLLSIPFMFVFVLIFAGLINITADFVVPVMMIEDCGVISGWQRFWPTLKREWKQYGVYLVIRWVLGAAVGFAVSVCLSFVAFGVGVVVFLLSAGAGLVFDSVGFLPLVLISLVGYLMFLSITLVVQIPVSIYFRHYSLLVLRETNSTFDLIPKQSEKSNRDTDTDTSAV